MESASIRLGHGPGDHGDHGGHEEQHGPPAANESSSIDRTVLGILLFILSEVMLFGGFFTSYFFLRIVVDPSTWPPQGYELPVLLAGINTVILVSSSLTVHYALEAIRRGNHRGLKLGLAATWLLGGTFLFIQIIEYVHVGFAADENAFTSIFYSLTGLHSAHVFVGLCLLTFANIRAQRGHFGPDKHDHLGVEVPGIYWHFVDVMWIVVFLTIYVL